MSDTAADMAMILTRLDDISRQLQGQHSSVWYTTKEAAAYLRCSVSKINQLTDRGKLPFKRQDPTTSRSPRLYHRKDLTAFLVTGCNPRKRRLSPEEKRLVEELL